MTPRTEMTPSTLLADLQVIVGQEHARAPNGGTDFVVDGLSPRAMVRPGTYDEVAGVLRHAGENRLAVIPFGGGSMMHLGNLPSGYDIAVDLSRINSIVEYEPADLTITCQAGITLADLQRRLAEAGQTLPLGPFSDARATIGGILASNRIGAYVHGHGKPRDMTIGMRIATTGGRIVRAGGRVVKNVAGYDLSKLHIGALGTLGVIVEATFKVAPLAAVEARCSYRMARVEDACRMAEIIQRSGLPARAIEIALHMDCDLTVDLAGSPRAVERSRAELGAMAAALGAPPADSQRAFPAPHSAGGLVCRFSALPERVPALMEALHGHGPRPATVAWPTAGIVFASWEPRAGGSSLLSEIRALTREVTTLVERCSPDLKRDIDVFGPLPPSFPLMRAIKQQFDPNGILSPGRFVGRL